MDKQIKRKWVKALLSGQYEQGAELLYFEGKYCCLGVLVHATKGVNPGPYWEEGCFREDFVTREVNQELATLNDEGVPFDMIAGLIDQAL